MWTYLVRRLLLMIPTLFGVTIVSFLIMQLAPGDPLMNQFGSGGGAGQSTQTHEAYLIQKRDLKLDKPILLNFNYFRDYRDKLRMANFYLARGDSEIAADLDHMASGADDPKAAARLEFLRSLKIPDFERHLAKPDERPRLARAVAAFAREYCEEIGASGVPAAIGILTDVDSSPRDKIGVIRALSSMVPEPFIYSYSRPPRESETPLIVSSWTLWWQRNKANIAPLDPDRQAVLQKQIAQLAVEPSRQKVFDQLEMSDSSDAPFYIQALLGNSTLSEKEIAALWLSQFFQQPLELDVPQDATSEQVRQAADNWIAHFEARRADYEPSLPLKTWRIVGDTQYAHMVWRLVTFNFGRSTLKTRDPVSEKIWKGFVVSAPLMLMAELFIYGVAIPLGIVCAVNRGRAADRLISLGLFLLYSIPAFVAGMLFLLFFCYGGKYLAIFPVEQLHSEAAETYSTLGYALDYLWHAFLPVVCLALFSLAGLAMYARSSMLEVLHQDYIRTAKAKGVSRSKIILKHALRNGLIPIITLFSSFLPAMLGGSVLVEYLFNIPGMGRLSFASIEQKDFPTLMALIYIEAIVVLASILLSDIGYIMVDPRISFSSQKASE